MGGFFETMSRHEGLAATYIPAMLIDHPVTTDRIAEARARAAQFPPRTAHDSQSYELIRERVRVLHHQRRHRPRRTTTSARSRAADADLADHYGYALDSPAQQPRRRGRQGADAAGATARDADTAARGPGAGAGQGRPHQGGAGDLRALRGAVPAQRAGHGALRGGRSCPSAARTMRTTCCSTCSTTCRPSPDQIRLTALAASAAGDAGDAYYYMGEYQIAGGDLNLAAQQLHPRPRLPAHQPDPAPALPGAPGRGARLSDLHAQAPADRQRRDQGQQPSGHRGGSYQ